MVCAGKVCTLVGDWHSHPDGEPVPSSIDADTWRKMSKNQSRNMVGAIFGREGVSLFWQGKDSAGHKPMRVTYEDDNLIIWELFREDEPTSTFALQNTIPPHQAF